MAAKVKRASTGVLLYAAGHPYYYRLAYNVAASMWHNDPGLLVSLVCDPERAVEHLGEARCERFHNLVPPGDTGRHPASDKWLHMRVKLALHEVTPYDHTLFVDADSIQLYGQRAATLLEHFKGHPLGCISRCTRIPGQPRGSYEPVEQQVVIWGDAEDYEQYFDIRHPWSHCISQVTYRENTPESLAYWRECVALHDLLTQQLADEGRCGPQTMHLWNGTVCDEPVMSVVTGLTQTYPPSPPLDDLPAAKQKAMYYAINQYVIGADLPYLRRRAFFLTLPDNVDAQHGDIRTRIGVQFYNFELQQANTALPEHLHGWPWTDNLKLLTQDPNNL